MEMFCTHKKMRVYLTKCSYAHYVRCTYIVIALSISLIKIKKTIAFIGKREVVKYSQNYFNTVVCT